MRVQVLFVAAGLAVGAAVLAACSSDGDDGLGFCFLDEQRARDLQVQTGADPRFAWCGAPAEALVVRQGGAVFWRLECVDPVRCIFPAVTYGQDPTTTPPQEVTAGPLDLVAGASYEVCVSQTVPVEATLCAPFTQ